MDSTDRDMLIEVRTQLQEHMRNLSSFREDLRNIFSKIETEAKSSAAIGAELKTFKETNVFKQDDLEKRLKNAEADINNILVSISDEKTERKESDNTEAKERKDADNAEATARGTFQTTVTSSFNTTRIIALTISGVAALIVAVLAIWEFFKAKGP